MRRFTPFLGFGIVVVLLAGFRLLGSSGWLEQAAHSLPGMGVFLVLSLTLCRLWMGIVDRYLLHAEPLSSIEQRQPYLPSHAVIVATLVATMAIFVLALKSAQQVLSVEGWTLVVGLSVFFGLLITASMLVEKEWPMAEEYVFSAIIGSAIAVLLLAIHQKITSTSSQTDPYVMALTILTAILVWRCLFGPWESHVKATVLGSFLFWIALSIVMRDTPDARLARILAGVVAIVPAMVWCGFFLRYHVQRMSVVTLMFFGGMLSTAPILFYDGLVRRSIELQFFFFRIVPENFNRTSSAFVSGSLVGVSGVRSTLLATLLSFMLVGLIEEASKFWILRRNARPLLSSIDDAMQLSIIVAIGFAFAENILNPSYFTGFVREYLLTQHADWGSFLGNVLGRAVLTNMVHILSTGIMGYVFGLALFAGPFVADAEKRGHRFWLARTLESAFGIPRLQVFRAQVVILGIVASVGLHGLFNFLVTFPDLLPNQPRSIGELFHLAPTSFLQQMPLLLVPSLLYVVGGCWLLSVLFERQENVRERGVPVLREAFVRAE